MLKLFLRFWLDDDGQDVAEYAVMMAVILVLVVAAVKLIGGNSNNVFFKTATSMQNAASTP